MNINMTNVLFGKREVEGGFEQGGHFYADWEEPQDSFEASEKKSSEKDEDSETKPGKSKSRGLLIEEDGEFSILVI